jgi:hypothetical protein
MLAGHAGGVDIAQRNLEPALTGVARWTRAFTKKQTTKQHDLRAFDRQRHHVVTQWGLESAYSPKHIV